MYIFEISCLSVASFAIIFSHSEGCLFTLLIVSFVVQKLLILIRSHLFNFAFISNIGIFPYSHTNIQYFHTNIPVFPIFIEDPAVMYVLAIINSAAMNIGVHVSLSLLVSSVCVPSSGIAGS